MQGNSLIFNVAQGDVPGGIDLLVSGIISGPSPITKQGSGLMAVSAANTYSGGTTIQAGTLQLAGTAATLGANTGALAVSSGATLDLNGYSVGVGLLSGNGTIDDVAGGGTSVLTIGNGAAGSSTFSGVIQNTTGTVSLVMAGSGTEVLTGANTYNGSTTVNGGTLTVATAASLPSSSAVTVNAGSVLNFSPSLSAASLASLAGAGNVKLNNALLTVGGNSASTVYSGVLSSAATSPTSGLVKTGSGTLTLGGNSTYAGATTVTAGTLKLGGGSGVVSLAGAGQDYTATAGSIAGGNFSIASGADVLVVELGWQVSNGETHALPTVTYNGATLTAVATAFDGATGGGNARKFGHLHSRRQSKRLCHRRQRCPERQLRGRPEQHAAIDAFSLSGVDLTKLPGTSGGPSAS